MRIIIRKIYNTHIDRLWWYSQDNNKYYIDTRRYTNQEFLEQYWEELYNEAISQKEFYETILTIDIDK